MWDMAFPGSVLFLKLFFKICIEQSVRSVDVTKALLAFPIDLAFLAFSFGAALLYARTPSSFQSHTVRYMFVAIVVAVVVLGVTTLLAKKSDNAFTSNRYYASFLLVLFAYGLGILALWGALNVNAWI